ncbi:MAG: dTMP kinase [Bacillota bacterium]|nr:dTMP kinase [Bacillota bacterium]
MGKGVFITFEGIDGCGKSLMLKRTAAALRERGLEPLLTREPGGSELGRRFRRLILDSPFDSVDERTETLLFAADRACHVRQVITPALEAGSIVLCDRYIDSTLAYQGYGRGLDIDFLRRLNDFAGCGLRPDLTLLLDVDPAIAAARRGAKADRMEQEQAEFFARVRAGYLALAGQCPRIAVIDASAAPERVAEQVWDKVRELL